MCMRACSLHVHVATATKKRSKDASGADSIQIFFWVLRIVVKLVVRVAPFSASKPPVLSPRRGLPFVKSCATLHDRLHRTTVALTSCVLCVAFMFFRVPLLVRFRSPPSCPNILGTLEYIHHAIDLDLDGHVVGYSQHCCTLEQSLNLVGHGENAGVGHWEHAA